MAPRTGTQIQRSTGGRKGRADEQVSALGVVAPPPILVESPRFSGSLATLFNCVKERKVDLLDVPLSPICEAYFAYLLHSEVKDLDEAGAALAALAYLLERKAWALLPTPEPEPEADESIQLALPTTHQYEEAIEALKIFHEEREKLFFRPQGSAPDAYEVPFTLGKVTLADLAQAFQRVLSKATPEPIEPLGAKRRSLSEEMRHLLGRLTAEFVGLEALLPAHFTRTDAVYGFLAVLELIRLGQVRLQIIDGEVQFARHTKGVTV
jgi:segregation and condensation protein A